MFQHLSMLSFDSSITFQIPLPTFSKISPVEQAQKDVDRRNLALNRANVMSALASSISTTAA